MQRLRKSTCHKRQDCWKKASDKAAGVDTQKDKVAANLEGQEDDDDDDELGNMELYSDDEVGLDAVGCEDDDDDSDDDGGDGDFEVQMEYYIEDMKQRQRQQTPDDDNDNNDNDWKTVSYRKGRAQTIRGSSSNFIDRGYKLDRDEALIPSSAPRCQQPA